MAQRSRRKVRWDQNIAKAKKSAGNAVSRLKKKDFKGALKAGKKALGSVKMGLFGQGVGREVTSRNASVVRDGTLLANTRNTRVRLGPKDKVRSITVTGTRPEIVSGSPRRTRNRSEAARKAAITRRARGR
jgi:hypothetical protein